MFLSLHSCLKHVIKTEQLFLAGAVTSSVVCFFWKFTVKVVVQNVSSGLADDRVEFLSYSGFSLFGIGRTTKQGLMIVLFGNGIICFSITDRYLHLCCLCWSAIYSWYLYVFRRPDCNWKLCSGYHTTNSMKLLEAVTLATITLFGSSLSAQCHNS